jgi:flavin-dependent dehydrogenase
MSPGAETVDALVVGAGPAGSLTACLAARAGLRVLLVERATFPRTKVCGCCLNPAGLAVLERAGLGHVPSELGAVPLSRIQIGAGRAGAVLPLTGVSLSRAALDAALAAAAVEAGATFMPGTTARLGDVEAACRVVELTNSQATSTVRARVVVAADGLGGSLLARAGLDAARPRADARIGAAVIVEANSDAYQPGTIYMACGRAGYLGLVRLEDGRLDLACAVNPDAVAGKGIGPIAAGLLSEVGWPVPDEVEAAPWKGTPRLTRSATTLAAERLFVVGDAAGYVEPFTGQGMAWALTGAEAVAPLVVAGCRAWSCDLIGHWERIYQSRVRGRQGLCGWLAWALRRPWLLRAATRILGVWPGLAAPVLRRLQHSGRDAS